MTLVRLIFACACVGIAAAHADDAPTLLRKYDCYSCHADTAPKTGPACVDVASKYRGDAKAAAKIATVIKKGKQGGRPWHMPPHPEISDAQARTMARYILSLKN